MTFELTLGCWFGLVEHNASKSNYDEATIINAFALKFSYLGDFGDVIDCEMYHCMLESLLSFKNLCIWRIVKSMDFDILQRIQNLQKLLILYKVQKSIKQQIPNLM